MSMGITYNRKMGFEINGVTIVDPAEYDYKTQSLDTSAERDTTGLLHRKMVASKYNVAIKWKGIDYEEASTILMAVKQPEFTFTFPCPEVPIDENDGLYTGRYYVGDRTVSMIKATDDDKAKWIVSMNFDLIEY